MCVKEKERNWLELASNRTKVVFAMNTIKQNKVTIHAALFGGSEGIQGAMLSFLERIDYSHAICSLFGWTLIHWLWTWRRG